MSVRGPKEAESRAKKVVGGSKKSSKTDGLNLLSAKSSAVSVVGRRCNVVAGLYGFEICEEVFWR